MQTNQDLFVQNQNEKRRIYEILKFQIESIDAMSQAHLIELIYCDFSLSYNQSCRRFSNIIQNS